MKKGLVLEGGGMRGMFSMGVCDVLMENGINFDGMVGVSAGAAFGCNVKSGQNGRAIRYNMKYCADKRFCSMWSLLTTGDVFGAEFCYRTIPEKLDLFDEKAFCQNPMEFYAVCTNVENGKPLYYKCKKGDRLDVKFIRASASMPLVSRVVKIGKYRLLDGGISDSVPLKFMEKKGYNKNIVVLTRPIDYVKTPNKAMPLVKIFLKKYPEVVKAMENRHIMYNQTIQYICKKEQAGEVFVIRPEREVGIEQIEKSPQKLWEVYQMGRNEAEKNLDNLKKYLQIS